MRRRGRTAIALTAVAGLLVAGPARPHSSAARDAAPAKTAPAKTAPAKTAPVRLSRAGAAHAADAGAEIPATVGDTADGRPLPAGFVGLSVEYSAIHAYTGSDPDSVNPVFVQLLRQLSPGSPPVLRIGGNSADVTWWPQRGKIPPSGVSYGLTKSWMRTTRALADELGAKLILGINLATDRPALASAEAQALLHGIGRSDIAEFEVGNEADLYGIHPWFKDRLGRLGRSRRRSYGVPGYIRDFSHWAAALPSVPLAGPSFARLTWMSSLSRILSATRRLGLVTFHRYPLSGCVTDPSSPMYPSLSNLLSDGSATGMAQAVAPFVAIAHGRSLPFRIDELNSASCTGAPGLSNTFASALWAIDALFNLAQAGVDGVNVHTLPGGAYEPFSFTRTGTTWSAVVHPVYYGMLVFVQAFPAGAELLPVTVANGPVKVWATQAPDGHTRVMLINKDPASAVTVQLQLPNPGAPAAVERLQAPSLTATAGVTLGGQTFGDATSTGTLAGTPSSEQVTPALGTYSVSLPAASAALLTR